MIRLAAWPGVLETLCDNWTMSVQLFLNEGIRQQLINEFCCTDILAGVLSVQEKDEVQDFYVLVAALEFDGVGVGKVPVQELAK